MASPSPLPGYAAAFRPRWKREKSAVMSSSGMPMPVSSPIPAAVSALSPRATLLRRRPPARPTRRSGVNLSALSTQVVDGGTQPASWPLTRSGRCGTAHGRVDPGLLGPGREGARRPTGPGDQVDAFELRARRRCRGARAGAARRERRSIRSAWPVARSISRCRVGLVRRCPWPAPDRPGERSAASRSRGRRRRRSAAERSPWPGSSPPSR